MDQFFSNIPTTPWGWAVSLIFTALLIFYLFNKVRENDMKILRDANTDLRDSIEDAEKKIVGLNTQVAILNEKVAILEKKNKTLEDLVITALKQYFFENPKVASTLHKAITATG